MNLDSVVPWGRSYEEYLSIFSLSNDDLLKNMLGCGDGPAGFNAELTRRGGNIVSIDPIYQFSRDKISSRIDEVYPQVMAQMKQNADDYVWGNIKDVAELGKIRMAAMLQFLSDYESGLESKRYISASLPTLPFYDNQYQLALCSHFLFLYSDHFNVRQHIQSMKELCRVASEVRVYPVLSLDGKQSRHLSAVIESLENDGIRTSLEKVKYQFQKGATEMLVAYAM